LSLLVCLCPESTDEDVDKLHCLNHSGSSATYSDYSPSQGSSGSSNPPANTHSHTHSHAHQHAPALPAPTKDQAPQTHWTNRYTCLLHIQFPHHPSLQLYIIFFSPSIPPLLQSPPSITYLIYLSNRPIHPLLLHFSVSFSSLCMLNQGQRESLECCRLLLKIFFLSSLLLIFKESCRVQDSVIDIKKCFFLVFCSTQIHKKKQIKRFLFSAEVITLVAALL